MELLLLTFLDAVAESNGLIAVFALMFPLQPSSRGAPASSPSAPAPMFKADDPVYVNTKAHG